MISKPWIDYKLRINWWNKVDEVDGSENEVYGTETESWFRFGLTWFAVDELWTISAIFFFIEDRAVVVSFCYAGGFPFPVSL